MGYNGNGIVLDGVDVLKRGQKYQSEAKQDFIDSIYSLFELFKNQNMKYLNEIAFARTFRRLEDPAIPLVDGVQTCPQLNTLNSTMDNMIADYVDNMPEVILAPESTEKEQIAREMGDVIGWVLHHAGLSGVWRGGVEDATVIGTGVMQDYFDADMYVGGVEGNIGLLYWPAESWLPDPLYDDFQQGRAVFKVCTHPVSWFFQHYPEVAEYIDPDGQKLMDYERDGMEAQSFGYDDPLVCLLEVWYRRYNSAQKRYEIHMAKVAGGVLLYDSRDDDKTAHGVYDHGMYPFTVLRFRKRKGTSFGDGMVAEYAATQRMINRCIKYIDDNARMSSRFKMIVSKQAGVDMTALMDMNQEVVQVEQRIGKEMMDWFQPAPLNSLVPNIMGVLQDTMKQDSGQNQWARGESGQGVTAASAISMLQNAGGKISRMHINDFIDDFKPACDRIVSMIGQFFKEKRVFTIYGEQGGQDTRQVDFDPQAVFGSMESYKRPGFMVRIMPQRSSPDQVEGFNNKVLKMVELSQNSNSPVPPLATVKMLQMTGKEQIIPILEAADQTQQMLAQMQQQIEALMQENEQLKKGVEELSADAQNKQQMLQAVGQQMSQQSAPSMPQPASPQTQGA